MREPAILFRMAIPYLGIQNNMWKSVNMRDVTTNHKRARPFYDYIVRCIKTKEEIAK